MVTRASATRSLTSFADTMAVSGLLAWGGVATVLARGESGVEELQAAASAGDALRKVMGELRPEQRWLIERCHAYEESVKKVAAELGGKGYRAVLREYHDLLELIGARMASLGIKEMPPWRADVSGQVLEGPPANDDG